MTDNAQPPWMVPNLGGNTTATRYLNINEASKECGLSPSVLRIWELRYGWPNPKRKANGYRSYSPHLVEDLKRMAALVSDGTPIRQLIIDGLPQWPRAESAPPAVPRTLDSTRSLPAPGGRAEAALREEIIRALETHRGGAVLEILQRAAWQVRQKDELDTALAPCVVALSELESLGRPLPSATDLQAIRAAIEGRCRQLQRTVDADSAQVRVLPLHSADRALAWVTCVALTRRHCPAVLCSAEDLVDSDDWLVVSDGILSGPHLAQACAIVGSQGDDSRSPLSSILDSQEPLAWLPKGSAV